MKKLTELDKGSKVYLMGICGTAMASLAGLLQKMGFVVTGSDQNAYPPMSDQLEALGISYYKGYHEDNLKKANPDYVIVGNVISRSNVEVATLNAMGLAYTSLPQALGDLFLKASQSLVVAGTHGKTTTTSALAWILEFLNKKPGFLIGGIPKNFNKSFELPRGDFFAIEGDEYDTAFFDKVPKFVHYYPKHAILTSIEFDHADIYESLDQIKIAFGRLIDLVPEGGALVYHGDDENIQSLLQNPRACRLLSYGFGAGNQVQVTQVKYQSGQTEFELYFKNKNLKISFKTHMYGAHNILNLTSVIALLHEVLGFEIELIQEALPIFQGVKRRQELLGEPSGVTVIEDFAHHPTAVAETIKALKSRYPGKTLWVIFEPRSATSRRKIFQSDYVQAFKEADHIAIMQAFDQSKIQDDDRFSSEQLAEELRSQGVEARAFAQVDQIVEHIHQGVAPLDVVVIMSNGGFGGIYQKLLTSLERLELKKNSNEQILVDLNK